MTIDTDELFRLHGPRLGSVWTEISRERMGSLLDEIDSLRAQVKTLRARLEEARRTRDAVLHLPTERNAKVRATAVADVAKWCERHAGDATLDRTGVERETLLRVAKNILTLAPCPSGFRVVEVETLEKVISCLKLEGRGVVTFKAALSALTKEQP